MPKWTQTHLNTSKGPWDATGEHSPSSPGRPRRVWEEEQVEIWSGCRKWVAVYCVFGGGRNFRTARMLCQNHACPRRRILLSKGAREARFGVRGLDYVHQMRPGLLAATAGHYYYYSRRVVDRCQDMG